MDVGSESRGPDSGDKDGGQVTDEGLSLDCWQCRKGLEAAGLS